MSASSPARGPHDKRARANLGVELPAGVDLVDFVDRIPAVLYIAEAGASGRWLYVSSGIEVLLGAGASPPPARSSDTAAFPIATAKGR
jgi:hypothetical protein